MQSKTSFFNKTAFRKNLTRFAPVWALYILALVTSLLLQYSNSTYGSNFQQSFRFACNFGSDMFQFMSTMNLVYALLVAQLLFGDLFNSRMCNALHALPLRREDWFASNIASGLVFSMVPTAVMAVLAAFLLAPSPYENAWVLAPLLWAAANLQFMCFYGIAAFSAMCVGSRLTMAAGYGLLNFGAYIGWWLVDTLYTPLLYGVITPTRLASLLSPIDHFIQASFVDIDLPNTPEVVSLTFTLTDQWWHLFALAAVGAAFAFAALALYRKRDLECAGDAVAFSPLIPVFQVLCSVFVMAAGNYVLYIFLGMGGTNYLLSAVLLCVGWFLGKMLLARSTRVFGPKNWPGLGLLAAALALSMVLTHFDVLGIARRVPAQEDIASIQFDSSYTQPETLEDPALMADILTFHRLAIADPVEEDGLYYYDAGGQLVHYSYTPDSTAPEDPNQYVQAATIHLEYTLKNGASMKRDYRVWTDSEAGQLARTYLSRWEHVLNERTVRQADGSRVPVLEDVLAQFYSLHVANYNEAVPAEYNTLESAYSFLEAVQADCAAGNMAQDPRFHRGLFIREAEDRFGEPEEHKLEAITVMIRGLQDDFWISVYPDSENCIRWLQERGLLDCQIDPDGINLG